MDIFSGSGCRNKIWYVCALVSFLGAITGTTVFCRSFTDNDVSAFIESLGSVPTGFFDYFFMFLKQELLFLLVTFIFSFFAFGWLTLPVFLFVRGLGIGISLCCHYEAFGLFGMMYSLPAIVLPYAVSLCVQALACAEAVLFSLSVFRFAFASSHIRRDLRHFICIMPVCSAVAVLSSCLSAVTRILIFSSIS